MSQEQKITDALAAELLDRGSLIDAWPEDERDAYRSAKGYDEREDAVLELRIAKATAALLPIIREAQAEAWAEGHESGFWNGRESSGHHEMRYVGLEHAQLNNPHRTESIRNG